MTHVDPDATWLQMTWLFYIDRHLWTNERVEAFLKAVPQDKLLLLDYYCENTEVWKQTDRYFGQPYLWCYLEISEEIQCLPETPKKWGNESKMYIPMVEKTFRDWVLLWRV